MPYTPQDKADTFPLVGNKDQQHHLPVADYMHNVYAWAYINPKNVRYLDQNWVVKTLLFFQDKRLFNCYLNHIQKDDCVWQAANVYSNLTVCAADKVGSNGSFDLTDITPIQTALARKKLAHRPWTKTICIDSAQFSSKKNYNLICSFFLLHEVPDNKKRAIVNNILSQLNHDGKAVFVDYHRPAFWNPLWILFKLVNKWLEPFSNALWHHEIKDYANDVASFSWTKRTLFGGVYQCVVAKPLFTKK